MWVHHHTQQQPTQDIHPSPTTITITTTTNNYYNHNQHHQPTPTQPTQPPPSRACVLAVACAPGCVLWAAFGQRQPASQPRQPANQRQPAHQLTSHSATSAISPPNKQPPQHTMPTKQPARRYLVCGNYSLIDSL